MKGYSYMKQVQWKIFVFPFLLTYTSTLTQDSLSVFQEKTPSIYVSVQALYTTGPGLGLPSAKVIWDTSPTHCLRSCTD